MTNKKRFFKAPMADQLMYFGYEFTDQHIRIVIHLRGQLKTELFHKALAFLVASEPILACKLVERKQCLYWQKLNELPIEHYVEWEMASSDPEELISRYLLREIDFFGGPNIHFKIFRYQEHDIICIRVSHMVADGGSLKDILYRLAGYYSELVRNRDFIPELHPSVDRSMWQLAKNLPPVEHIKIFRDCLKDIRQMVTQPTDILIFPWQDSNKAAPGHLQKLVISPERFESIKSYGQKRAATVNDILATAFLRAFRDVAEEEKSTSKAKCISIPVDLRKFLKQQKTEAACNMSGNLILNLGSDIGSSFDETLARIKPLIHKEPLNNLIFSNYVLSVIFSLMPYEKRKANFSFGSYSYASPPALTNVGIIDEKLIKFGSIEPEQAFFISPATYCSQLFVLVSTFKKTMTFACAFKGSERDEAVISAFFTRLDAQLRCTQIENLDEMLLTK